MNYYAFNYLDGKKTTWADDPKKICGEIHRFQNKETRDAFVNEYNFTQKNNLRPCEGVTRKELIKMGHANYFTEFED